MEKAFSFDFVFDTQSTFRKLMDAMSHPFQKYSIAEESKGFDDEQSLFLTIGCTLLDNETSFYVEKNTALMTEIQELTLSNEADIRGADYILLSSELNYETIRSMFQHAKKGDFYDPHKSATFIIYAKADDISEKIIAEGPGIKEQIDVATSKYVKNILEIRTEETVEYPCGIDLVFLFDNGDIMGCPRLIKTREV